MYFHEPSRRASRPEWWTEWSRPTRELAEQGRQDVEAVGRGPSREHLAGHRREAGQQIDLVHQGLGDAGPDPAGPADQERHPRAPLEQAVLAPAERTGRPVAVEVADGPVRVAVVHHGAVVAGEHDERTVRELEPVERVEDLPDAPVQLLHDVAAHAASALPREPGVRDARDVDVVGGEVEEERPGRVPLDERDGLAGEDVGHVLVRPIARTFPPAMDPIRLMPLTIVWSWPWLGFSLEQVGVRRAGRLVADRLAVTDPDRVARIEARRRGAPG